MSYKEIDNTDCNQKPTKLLDCALIGVCAVIRSNTVFMPGGLFYLTVWTDSFLLLLSQLVFYSGSLLARQGS